MILKLKDGTEITVELGYSGSSFTVKTNDISSILLHLSDDNLSSFSYYISDTLDQGFSNKKLSTYRNNILNGTVTFYLTDNTESNKIIALEDTIIELVTTVAGLI